MQKPDIRPIDVALSLVLLTRLPLPHLPKQAFARQAQAVWAFPLAGLTVAVPACLAAAGALWVGLPSSVAAGFALLVQVLLTGAMHEDGLADSADGLWGGFEIARRLEIMKDSRIGAYGVLALILSFGLRWNLYIALFDLGQIWAPVALAALSRAAMPVLMRALPNARKGGLSSQVGRPGWANVTVGLLLALALCIICVQGAIWGMLLAAAAALCIVGWLARVKIGGQTGDILGASQQITEISCAMAVLVLL